MMVLRPDGLGPWGRGPSRREPPAADMPSAASAPPLSRLRSDLARLRWQRTLVRIGSGAATAGVLLLVAACVAFGVDYLADLRPMQRAIALVAIVAASGWAA